MAAPVTSADDLAYVTQLVRSDDLPRYYATLFAPPELRADLLAVYGFAAELARIPDLVKEPGLGTIRLKWWGDALMEAVRREGQGETPALRAAAAAILRRRLPVDAFIALGEARMPDLYSDPPASLADLESRLGETESVIFQLAALVLGSGGAESADASGHAGVAYGAARRLSAFATDRRRGRTIATADMLAAEGLTGADVFASPPPAGLERVVTALAGFAEGHLRKAQALVADLAPAFRPAYLPLTVVGRQLEGATRLGSALAEHDPHSSNLGSLARIGWAGVLGRSGRRRVR